jgi:hypothetical protein
MAAMAEHEREMISARTKAGLDMVRKEIAEKGFRISRSGARIEKLGNPNWRESLEKARANGTLPIHQNGSRRSSGASATPANPYRRLLAISTG